MAKFVIGNGLNEYSSKLEKLNADTEKVLGKAIYKGAGIVADEIKKNIKAIPVSNSSKRGTPSDPIDTITSAQRTGLIDGFGISKARTDNGYVNVKLGFDGYNTQVSDTAKKAKYTNSRQANSMIARSVENGTSFRKKHPFIAPAIRATKDKAEKAMAEELDKEIAKRMEGIV